MYQYNGKVLQAHTEYVPFSTEEVAAKFAHYRESEELINGGPWPETCGTNPGYYRHLRLNEERCDPCKAAHSKSERERTQKQAA